MEVRLVVEKGKTPKTSYRLQSGQTVIGRRQDCDLRIVSSEVSRRHCVLTINGNHVEVEDLDSVNGTFLNGSRVAGRKIVRPNDRLDVGPVRFVVKYEMSKETLHRLEPTVEAQSLQEELEELPLAEIEDLDEDFVLAEVEEDDEDLPLAQPDDEDTKYVGIGDEADEETPRTTAEDEDEDPIPFEEDFEDSPSWQLPQAGELRDILSQMDPEPPKKQHEE